MKNESTCIVRTKVAAATPRPRERTESQATPELYEVENRCRRAKLRQAKDLRFQLRQMFSDLHLPTFPKHEDLCVVAGVQASTLTTTAQDHDPKHDPYGICWSMPQEVRYRATFIIQTSNETVCSAISWICYRAILASTDRSVTLATSSDSLVF